MRDGEAVCVEAPADKAPPGTCAWCGQGFVEGDDGDMRRVAMLTEVEDGTWDWLSGDFIHGECDYARDEKTKEEMAKEEEGE